MRRSAVVVALCCALSGLALAQEQRGAVEGTVRDETGAPLPGASVEARRESAGASLRTSTDQDGVYRFVALAPGRYVISASWSGLAPARRPSIDVGLGVVLRADFTLGIAKEQEVVVTGDAPAIDPRPSASFTESHLAPGPHP